MVLTQGMTRTQELHQQAGSDWIVGTVDGLEVQAKAYDEPSGYGMAEDGRISKLSVRIPNGAVLYEYDRNDIGRNDLTAEEFANIVDKVGKAIR